MNEREYYPPQDQDQDVKDVDTTSSGDVIDIDTTLEEKLKEKQRTRIGTIAIKAAIFAGGIAAGYATTRYGANFVPAYAGDDPFQSLSHSLPLGGLIGMSGQLVYNRLHKQKK
jgi:hypothetical protein